jgi:outer membrane receptor protein involved in Fe transport
MSRCTTVLLALLVSACSSERLTGPAAQDAARQYQATTMAATAEPLFLVDGKESSSIAVRALKPESIEAVEVLKGKAAAERFGDRGRSGVVIVKTKSAEKGDAR